MKNKITADCNKLSLLIISITSIIVSLMTSVVFIGYIKYSQKTNLIEPSNCIHNNIISACYFDKTWDSSNYLSTLTSFYNTIIVILITIITLIGALAFLSIKHSAKNQIDAQLPELTEDYFNRRHGKENLREIFYSEAAELTKKVDLSATSIESIQKNYTELYNQLMVLNDKVIDMQNRLEDSDDGIITPMDTDETE